MQELQNYEITRTRKVLAWSCTSFILSRIYIYIWMTYEEV